MSCRSSARSARRCCIVQRRCTARIAACRSHPKASAAFRGVRLSVQGGQADSKVQAACRLPAQAGSSAIQGPRGGTRTGNIIRTKDGLQLGSSAWIL